MSDDDVERLAADIRARALVAGVTVAVAESLTGGAVCQALAKAGDAEAWFAGGVVAYRDATKFRALGVPEGPVVTPETARAMAVGVRALIGADATVALTGVGGPGPAEGRPPGTVFIATASGAGLHDFEHRFDGDPATVVHLAVVHALRHLAAALLDGA